MNNTNMEFQRRVAMQAGNQADARPDIHAWRVIERAIRIGAQGKLPDDVPICHEGEHKCEWDDGGTTLRCAKCGLDCT